MIEDPNGHSEIHDFQGSWGPGLEGAQKNFHFRIYTTKDVEMTFQKRVGARLSDASEGAETKGWYCNMP
jgi:hypothetical protein